MSSPSKIDSAVVEIDVEDVSGFEPVPDHAEIKRWIARALTSQAPGELSVRIVGEAESAALNARYRGRQGSTNVLAFAGPDPRGAGGARLLGDIVICAPVVAREALEQAKPHEAHWAHIAIHGVLHLLGYDHEREAEARIMERREVELLAELGFDDPY